MLQAGWKRWKSALKQSNQLDDEGFEDEAARAAAKMVADAHKKFAGQGKGKGKRAAAADEEDAEPFSLLHKVCLSSQQVFTRFACPHSKLCKQGKCTSFSRKVQGATRLQPQT